MYKTWKNIYIKVFFLKFTANYSKLQQMIRVTTCFCDVQSLPNVCCLIKLWCQGGGGGVSRNRCSMVTYMCKIDILAKNRPLTLISFAKLLTCIPPNKSTFYIYLFDFISFLKYFWLLETLVWRRKEVNSKRKGQCIYFENPYLKYRVLSECKWILIWIKRVKSRHFVSMRI